MQWPSTNLASNSKKPMKQTNLLSFVVIFALSIIISACSSSSTPKNDDNPNKGRYQMDKDETPRNPPDLSKIQDAQPKYEPYSRGGNKPYSVFGVPYKVMASAENYKETGKASYYGSKFHGYHTSNGEVYDMYSMSAAHKTLPLPSYVRVTNLENKKTIIVRVNDRGPFHSERIIDLSYAAAYKLGMVQTGVANIMLEAIVIPPPSSYEQLAMQSQGQSHYIQIVASKDKARLNLIAQKLESSYQLKSRLQPSNDLYRLQLGPIGQVALAEKLLENLKRDGYPQSYIVTE